MRGARGRGGGHDKVEEQDAGEAGQGGHHYTR